MVNNLKLIYIVMFIPLIILTCANSGVNQKKNLESNSFDDLQKADEELMRLYNEILVTYKDDTLFLEKLTISQRAWVTFKKAYLESLYPEKNKLQAYGSSYSKCYQIASTILINQRINQLLPWLEGKNEGDTCAGSIRIHQK